MQTVIFTAPILNVNAIPTIRTLIEVPDTRVILISQEDEGKLTGGLRQRLDGFVRVENALDSAQLLRAAQHIRDRVGTIDRMFASNEQVQVPVAVVREQLGIAGMSSETMLNFRDKSRMKTVLREKQIPCARFALISDSADASAFIETVGFPVIAKPPAGAGAEFTYQIADDATLQSVLAQHRPSPDSPLLLEEFISGDEHSFDAFIVKGKVIWHSLTRYLPAPLEVKRNAWIQWRVVLPREVDDPAYDDIRKVAKKGLKALGAETGICHMEWFRRKDGSPAISEVGMRPPGAQITTLMSRANDFDCLGAWARLMITGKFTPPERKYASGCAYLRGQGHGVVRGVHGFEQISRDLGGMITDVRLPEYGQVPTGSYEGEGFIIVRHPDTQVVEDALLQIVSNMHVTLG